MVWCLWNWKWFNDCRGSRWLYRLRSVYSNPDVAAICVGTAISIRWRWGLAWFLSLEFDRKRLWRKCFDLSCKRCNFPRVVDFAVVPCGFHVCQLCGCETTFAGDHCDEFGVFVALLRLERSPYGKSFVALSVLAHSLFETSRCEILWVINCGCGRVAACKSVITHCLTRHANIVFEGFELVCKVPDISIVFDRDGRSFYYCSDYFEVWKSHSSRIVCSSSLFQDLCWARERLHRPLGRRGNSRRRPLRCWIHRNYVWL